MKLTLKILLAAVVLLLGFSSLYAQQMIALDPVFSYESRGEPFSIPIGATFLEPSEAATHYDLFVTGLPSGIVKVISKVSPFKITGYLRQVAAVPQGVYYITITAMHYPTSTTSSATMKLKIGSELNAPIIFDPLEQIKVLRINTWYSLALGVTDNDPESLLLSVTGAVNNGLGYVKFVKTEDELGRTGGVLLMYLSRPGELKLNLIARDRRGEMGPYNSNSSLAQLHFLVR